MASNLSKLIIFVANCTLCEAAVGCDVCRYNYSRDDEAVYKEFLEIANEMIPNIMRTSCGDQSEQFFKAKYVTFSLDRKYKLRKKNSVNRSYEQHFL